jgi:hypothetical protein
MHRLRLVAAVMATALLAACAVVPAGPSQPALPGSRVAWDRFQADDASCRQFAAARGGVPSEAAASAGVGSAVVGTALGAAIGGLLGGSEGAAVGAGMGLFTGGVIGAGNAQVAAAGTQQRYDAAYFQCMYAAGHRVPAPAGYVPAGRAPANVASRSAPLPAARTTYGTPPNAAIPPPDAPAPRGAAVGPPPDAAIPPPNTPPPGALPSGQSPAGPPSPYRLPR